MPDDIEIKVTAAEEYSNVATRTGENEVTISFPNTDDDPVLSLAPLVIELVSDGCHMDGEFRTTPDWVIDLFNDLPAIGDIYEFSP